ncbi:hypothetical protein AM592_10305 [Bacillus gobiensis]|uniref:Uncharacterized protein n=1 Tax=Bacillus gobiensis TaxID=1441095 RepID=A0A0M5JLU0_9BACI|nr:hypothetical protein AM592_10305 [Bacillus gobiensis]
MQSQQILLMDRIHFGDPSLSAFFLESTILERLTLEVRTSIFINDLLNSLTLYQTFSPISILFF